MPATEWLRSKSPTKMVRKGWRCPFAGLVASARSAIILRGSSFTRKKQNGYRCKAREQSDPKHQPKIVAAERHDSHRSERAYHRANGV